MKKCQTRSTDKWPKLFGVGERLLPRNLGPVLNRQGRNAKQRLPSLHPGRVRMGTILKEVKLSCRPEGAVGGAVASADPNHWLLYTATEHREAFSPPYTGSEGTSGRRLQGSSPPGVPLHAGGSNGGPRHPALQRQSMGGESRSLAASRGHSRGLAAAPGSSGAKGRKSPGRMHARRIPEAGLGKKCTNDGWDRVRSCFACRVLGLYRTVDMKVAPLCNTLLFSAQPSSRHVARSSGALSLWARGPRKELVAGSYYLPTAKQMSLLNNFSEDLDGHLQAPRSQGTSLRCGIAPRHGRLIGHPPLLDP